MNIIKNFFKQLFCRHRFDIISEDYDVHKYSRVFTYKCRFCEKIEKRYFSGRGF